MTALGDLASMAAFCAVVPDEDDSRLAEENGRIFDFCTHDDDNIGALHIARAARSRGIGKRLLDLAKAERDWITVWAFERKTRARAFYARQGLVEV